MDEHRIDPSRIETVRVKTFEEAAALFQGYPGTTEEAQFSVKWPLACLIIDRELGPDQVLEKRFSDPEVISMFDRIEVEIDPEVDRLYKEMKEMDLRMHSAVEITLKEGSIFDSGIVERGADRYSAADLENKFRKLTKHVLAPEIIDQLVDMVWNFEELEDVKELTALL